jgi:serine/threonine protein kinase
MHHALCAMRTMQNALNLLPQRHATRSTRPFMSRWTKDTRDNEHMVVEFVKMGSLDKVLLTYGRKLRNRVKVAMCEQICSAMCELASAGVLHRDLAVRNILVSSMVPVHVKVRALDGES